jgi:predicted MarR family transcription regulator
MRSAAGSCAAWRAFYETTDTGRRYLARYREIRERCLVESVSQGGTAKEEIRRAAQVLRTLSGHYDQAARTASSL